MNRHKKLAYEHLYIVRINGLINRHLLMEKA